ncbi:MAG: hypothetical protein M5R36_02500 [Deltaproteobacteria bacterium]|nr:hypothetical protein [Deltaproteobacteria bacterium]
MIVLVSPFGQSLFEHGLLGHGTSLYDDEIRVPFIVADPARVAPGAVLPGPAGLADVAPTILGITGARPPDGMEGVSLWPLLTNAPSAPEVAAFLETRALFVETNRRGPSRFAVIKERRKFIASPPFGLFGHRFGSAVYDLDADPGETDNLLAGDESLAAPFDEAIEQAGGYRRATQWSVLFGAGKQVYSGTVSTAGTLYEIYKDDVVLGVEGEGRVVFNDLLMLPAADAIRFAAAEMERPNGFRFFVRPEGALVHFTLLADGRRAPKRIALGASSEQPHRIPFVIGGGYAGSDLQPAPGAYRVFSERLWISDTAAEGRRAEESVGPSVELLEKLRRRVRPWEKGPAKALEQYLRGAP